MPADQLVTTAQVKARVAITDGVDDGLLSTLIDDVSSYIQHRTMRRLLPTAATQFYVDTEYGSLIYVRRGIRAVTLLEVASTDQPSTGGSYTAFSGSIVLRPAPVDLRVGWPADTILLLGSAPVLRTAINGARITGDWDFAACPEDVQGVAIDAIAAALAGRADPVSSTLGADSAAAYPWDQFFTEGSPQADVLNRYRGVGGIG